MGALESVGDYAFENSGFTSFDVTRLSSKIQLGEGVFASCAALTQIKLSPETLAAVTELPRLVFKDCAKLQISLSAFSSLTSIGYQALYGCLTLADVVAPASLVSIGPNAFQGSSITSFDASNVESTLEMGGGDFLACQNLVTVTLSPHVTQLPSSVFADCIKLQTITNFPSIESIGPQAFSGCSSLAMDFKAPSTLTSIGESAFEESAITSFDASDVASQLHLDSSAFSSCARLRSVVFSQQPVTELPPAVFYKCTSLESLSDLTALESVGSSALQVCSSLAIEFIASESLTYVGVRAFEYSGITSFDASKVKSTLELNNNAFGYCTGLLSVKFPAHTPTTYPNSLFSDCTSLNSVTGPSSLTSIDYSVFWKCSSLAIEFIAPESLTLIHGTAFGESAITSFDASKVGANLELDEGVFLSCRGLRSITFSKQTTTAFQASIFEGCTSLNVANLPSVTSIGERAFFGCGLGKLTVPASLTFIGESAFEESTITSFDASPECLDVHLSPRAFALCTSLTTVQFSCFRSLQTQVFFGCSSLTEFTAPASLDLVPEFAFEGSGLIKANLEAATTCTLNPQAFAKCQQMKEFVFPEGIVNLPYRLFLESGLVSITIPETIVSIGDECFSQCRMLENVTYLGMNEVTGWFFQDCDSLTDVFVPHDYPYYYFGEMPVTPMSTPESSPPPEIEDSTPAETPGPPPPAPESNGNGATIGIAVGVSLTVVVIVVVVVIVLWRLGKFGGRKEEEKEHNLVSV